MTRFAILAALAVVTPIRRGLTLVEAHLGRAEYRLRAGTSALFIVLACVVACAPIQRRRAIAAIERECVHAIERAPTSVDVHAIAARCHDRIREVTDAE